MFTLCVEMQFQAKINYRVPLKSYLNVQGVTKLSPKFSISFLYETSFRFV